MRSSIAQKLSLMLRRLALFVVAASLLACAPTGSTREASPSASTGTSEAAGLDCLGGLEQKTCDKVVEVVLRTVAPSGWTPVHVWVTSGSLAPTVDLLFDPNANFPAPNVPVGGTMLGSAEVAFAGTDEHAGMNLAVVGTNIVADLIGYVVPRSGWCSGICPSGSTTDGPFRLELVLPRLNWKADEPISGTAILSFDGSAPTTIYGSGASVVAFGYAEVGGTRKVDPEWDADCGPHPVDPATPINATLSNMRPPPGTWDIISVAHFTDGASCPGTKYSMSTSVRITVGN
jgi:hypothetical protein